MIDCHCHLLPGLDDGPADNEESLRMGRILVDVGFTAVYCTPHFIRGSYNNDKPRVVEAVHRLQSAYDMEGLPLRLHPGTEYYMDEFLSDHLIDPLPVGDPPRILVESAFNASPELIKERVYQIVRKGHVPLLAHAERYEYLDHDISGSSSIRPSPFTLPSGLLSAFFSRFIGGRSAGFERLSSGIRHRTLSIELLTEMGCLFQGNIGSFAGRYGEPVRRRAIMYLESGLYSRLATDAHRSEDMEKWLVSGLRTIEKVVGENGIERLLGENRTPPVL